MTPFEYRRPGTVADAVAGIAQSRSKLLGGGANLVEPMRMAVEQPARISGNLCRCGAYVAIVAAVRSVAGGAKP
jgi:aerobic-type carbon monoxide dehydrogenase small subunit (CoxS/CutS family)